MKAALIANYLCSLQPLTVQSRLLHDETFRARFGLVSPMVMTIGGDMHVDQQKLVAAARRALVDLRTESLRDVDGHEMVVKVEQGCLFLESPPKGKKVKLNELLILSSNQEERTQTLRQLIDRLGPTAPDFSALLTTAVGRELSDAEVGDLLAERASGVAPLQARADVAFTTNQVTLENLV